MSGDAAPRFDRRLHLQRFERLEPVPADVGPVVVGRVRLSRFSRVPGSLAIALIETSPALTPKLGARLIGLRRAGEEGAALGAEIALESTSAEAEICVDPRAVARFDDPAVVEDPSQPVILTLKARLTQGRKAKPAPEIEIRATMTPPAAETASVTLALTPLVEAIDDAVLDAAIDGEPAQALFAVQVERKDRGALLAPWSGRLSLGGSGAPPGALSLRWKGDSGPGAGQTLPLTLAAEETAPPIEVVGLFSREAAPPGGGWLSEPTAPSELMAAVRAEPLAPEVEARASLPMRPRAGAAELIVEARPSAPDASAAKATLPLGPEAPERLDEPLTPSRGALLRAGSAATAPTARRRVMTLDLTLRGHVGPDGLSLQLTPALLSKETGAPLALAEEPPVALIVEALEARGSGGLRFGKPREAAETGAAALSLGPQQRRLHVVVEIEEAALRRLAREAANRPLLAEIGLSVRPVGDDAADAAGGATLTARCDVRVIEERRSALALDLGAESVSAAIWAPQASGRDAFEMVDLGGVLARQDPAHAEQGGPFLSAAVGVGAEASWRLEDWPLSLWATADRGAPPAALAIDPEMIRRGQRRRHVIGAPPRPGAPAVRSPAMALAEREGKVTLEGEEIDAAQLLGDALHEIADFYLPRAEIADAAEGAPLLLTHPNLIAPAHRARLERAARRMIERLGGDPSSPGALSLIPQGDAAVAAFLERLEPAPSGPALALALDVGAAELDMTVVALDPAAPGAVDAAPTRRVRRRLGARLGGDAIDLTLYFIVSRALAAAAAGRGISLEHPPLQPAGDSGAAAERHRAAKKSLAEAITAAKRALADACRHAAVAGGPRWPEEIAFTVQVGSVSGETPWPLGRDAARMLSETAGGARSLGGLRRRGDRLELTLPKSAVARPAMRQLMQFMTGQMLELARLGGPSPTHVGLSGRGALWPLLGEALDAALALAETPAAAAPPLELDPSAMKRAAAMGALALARRPFEEDETRGELALLIAGAAGGPRLVRPEHWSGGLVKGEARLALWPEGLSPDALEQPWRRSLIALSDETVEIEDGAVAVAEGGVVTLAGETLRLDRIAAPPGPSFASVDHDIWPSPTLAPPGWPESCAPDPKN